MAKISIIRKSEYQNKLRSYRIYIDGVKVGKVADGAMESFEVTAGTHTIEVKIDWCSSPTISLNVGEGEQEIATVGSNKFFKWFSILSIVIIGLHFILSITNITDYTLYALIPLGLMLVYYLTIGRKQFLTLTKGEVYD